MNSYANLRHLLFHFDPEGIHAVTLLLMRLAGAVPPIGQLLRRVFAAPQKPVQAFGLTFPNPVGLAAGYDKDGDAWRGLACLGFGHIEIGTVTPRPQPGNPRPRVFRLPEAQAVINRMGFPGKGAEYVARRLAGARPPGLILGANLGRNKDSQGEQVIQDYVRLFRTFAPRADYLAINVSSPNTPGLRQLQAGRELYELLQALGAERIALSGKPGGQVPVLVKLAPDLEDAGLDEALDVILQTGMQGVIATNTTLQRPGLEALPPSRKNLAGEAGGLSGTPLRQMSTEMVRKIVQRTGEKLPVIGVGGILDADGAKEKLEAGACLVQVCTGLVYAGPGLVKEIIRKAGDGL